MARHYSANDLSQHTSSIIAEARASKEPVLITQNGTANVIVVDADTYLSNMQALVEFMRIYKGNAAGRRKKHNRSNRVIL